MKLYSAMLLFVSALSLVAADRPQRNVTVMPFDTVIPQVADGGGWRTTITLVNLDIKAASYKLNFYADSGTPIMFSFPGIGSYSTLQGQIAIGGSVTIRTSGGGLGTPLTQGWAALDTEDQIGGMAVFEAVWMNQEAVVPISSAFDTRLVLPFDNVADFVTSFAMVNPWPWTDTVTIAIRDEAGNRIALDQFPLSGGQHLAFELAKRYRDTAGKRGVMEVSTTGMGIPTLGLRFNPRGAFTSFHSLSGIGW